MNLSNGFKKYAQNTGHLFVEKIARTIVTLTVWAFVIRYLGPEKFGIFSYALSFVFLFSILSDLGLDSIVVRDLVKNAGQKEVILGSVFLLKFIGAIFAIFAIVVATGMLSVEYYTKAVILIISICMVFRTFNNIDFYFQSCVLSKYTVYSQLLALMVTSILCLTFIQLKMPLIYFAHVVVIESAVVSIGLVIFYTIRGQQIFSWRFNLAIIKGLLKNSWPIIFSGFAISVYMRIDQIMIKQILGADWTGYYSAAVRVSEVFYFIPIVIAGSLFPAIVNAKQKSELLYYNRLQALFTFLLWIALIISLCISTLAFPLIQILFGQKYLQSAGVLSIHAWAGIFVFLGVVRGKWAINENLQFFIMIYAILGAIANIVLNIILLPIFSIQGAAFATIISYSIAAVLGNLLSKKTRKIFFLQMRSFNVIAVWKLWKQGILKSIA